MLRFVEYGQVKATFHTGKNHTCFMWWEILQEMWQRKNYLQHIQKAEAEMHMLCCWFSSFCFCFLVMAYTLWYDWYTNKKKINKVSEFVQETSEAKNQITQHLTWLNTLKIYQVEHECCGDFAPHAMLCSIGQRNYEKCMSFWPNAYLKILYSEYIVLLRKKLQLRPCLLGIFFCLTNIIIQHRLLWFKIARHNAF